MRDVRPVTNEILTETRLGDLWQCLERLLDLGAMAPDLIRIDHEPSPGRRLPLARRLAPLLRITEKGDIDTGLDLNRLDPAPGHLRGGMRAAPGRTTNRWMTAIAATPPVTATVTAAAAVAALEVAVGVVVKNGTADKNFQQEQDL